MVRPPSRRRLTSGLACAAAATVGFALTATAEAFMWSSTRQLVPVSVQTFSPRLAVNDRGSAVAAWFSGPPPVVTAASPARLGHRPRTWHGNNVMVSSGSITGGLGRPVIVGRNGSDIDGQIKVALSGSGVAFVVWQKADGTGEMIVTSRAGHLGRPRRLGLPPGSQLQRLAFGRHGPVDALSYQANGHGYAYFCTRLNRNGTTGLSFIAHPSKPNPCRLPATSRMNTRPPASPRQPAGYALAPYSLIARTDGQGNAIALWDDYRTAGNGYTHGLFYAVQHP